MSVQDNIAIRQMESQDAARERINESAMLTVRAAVSPGRLARMTGEDDKLVQLKATDLSAMEFEVIQGHSVFDGKSKIDVSELFSKRSNDPEDGYLRIPGTGHVAQKLSGALNLLNLRNDVSVYDALKISERTPGLRGLKFSDVAIAVDIYRNETANNIDVEDSPEISTPKARR